MEGEVSLSSILRRPTNGEWEGLTDTIQRFVAADLPLSPEKADRRSADGMGSIAVDDDDKDGGEDRNQ
jgi:hypothetical protein